MVKVLMVLTSFRGFRGNAINERRVAQSLFTNYNVEKVYVLTIPSIIEYLSSKKSGIKANSKLKIFALPRLPSPTQSIFMLQLIFYGFILSGIAYFMKLFRIIDIIYVRESWLAYGFVSLNRILDPMAIKIVSLATEDFFKKTSNISEIFRLLSKALETFVIRNASIIFTVPGSFFKRLSKFRDSKNHIYIIPQPIPKEFFEKNLKPKFAEDILVGYVGSISAAHSVDTIVKAISLIQKDVPNLKLIIAGDGDPRYLSYINSLSIKLKVNTSIILRISENEMPSVYKSLKLLLIPRSNLLDDVVPMKFLEATAANLPIVATKTKALSQLLNGSGVERLILVDNEDLNDWAQKIMMLLIDSEKRKLIIDVISKQLQHILINHKPKNVARKILKTLEKSAQ